MAFQLPRILSTNGGPGNPSGSAVATGLEPDMKTPINLFPLKKLMVTNTAGTLNLAVSKAALKLRVANTKFEAGSEVLMDFREVACEMTTTDIFEFAALMAHSTVALTAGKRIAVLVDDHRHGHLPFNLAQFRELCADNRILNVHAFEDARAADEWLNPQAPSDPAYITTMPRAKAAILTSPP
jgi:hypothetical protein